jgi:pimeloyl-[acyl-carrier protein] methyl ester esterase
MNIPSVSLVFVHGWGFDGSFWDGLRDALSEFPSVTIDLGFLGSQNNPPAPSKPSMPSMPSMPIGPCVAIGHSLGFLWLLKNRPVDWHGLISINGFARFPSPGPLARMTQSFDLTPDETTHDFLKSCGLIKMPQDLNTPRLREGLNWLADWDQTAALTSQSVPVQALWGTKDPIIGGNAFSGLSNVAHRSYDGGHLLPLTATRWCAKHIRNSLVAL